MMYSQDYLVTQEMTAESMKSGDLPVLATPSVIAIVEQTCRDYLSQELAAEMTTVGVAIECQHLLPTVVSKHVLVTIQLIEQTERKSRFTYSVFDNQQEIARGTHTRVIVNREKFMQNISM